MPSWPCQGPATPSRCRWTPQSLQASPPRGRPCLPRPAVPSPAPPILAPLPPSLAQSRARCPRHRWEHRRWLPSLRPTALRQLPAPPLPPAWPRRPGPRTRRPVAPPPPHGPCRRPPPRPPQGRGPLQAPLQDSCRRRPCLRRLLLLPPPPSLAPTQWARSLGPPATRPWAARGPLRALCSWTWTRRLWTLTPPSSSAGCESTRTAPSSTRR
mmetsp:Transcript_25845/g.97332  ORF Transcript_25845/g.97332 Transcript_25845/m.97332 type:complete len:212 (-) Transcript_25845:728-1363(-)